MTVKDLLDFLLAAGLPQETEIRMWGVNNIEDIAQAVTYNTSAGARVIVFETSE